MSVFLRAEQRWHAAPARTRALVLDGAAVLLCGCPPVIWSWHQGDNLRWSLAAAAVLLLRRHFPVCTLVIMGSIEWLSDADIFPALGCAAYSVAMYGRPRSGILGAAAVGLALGFAPWDSSDSLGPSGEVAFQVLLPTTIGLYVRRSRQLLHAQQQRTEALQREQELVTERAVLRERARIAREVHDALGHQLSIVVLHAGALALAGGPAAERGELIRTVGKEALQDLRRVIGVLGDGELTNEVCSPADPRSVRELVRASQRAGLPVEATFGAELDRLDPCLDAAVHGVLREALTNVHKHAGHVRTRVSVRNEGGGGVCVEVHNEPPPTPPTTHGLGSGSGLAALAEQVRLLGGRFEHGPTPSGGFLVRASLPPRL